MASHTRTATKPISGRPLASAPRAVAAATAFSSIRSKADDEDDEDDDTEDDDDDDDDEDDDTEDDDDALDDGHSAPAANRIALNARPTPPPRTNAPIVGAKSDGALFHSHTLAPSVSPARTLPLPLSPAPAPSANAASINEAEPLPCERTAAAADFCCLTWSACCSAARFLRM